MYLQGHTLSVISVAFSPNGNQIVSGSDDRSWCGCGMQRRVSSRCSCKDTSAVRSVAFSPDGNQIVSGSDDDMYTYMHLKLFNIPLSAFFHILICGFVSDSLSCVCEAREAYWESCELAIRLAERVIADHRLTGSFALNYAFKRCNRTVKGVPRRRSSSCGKVF